MWSLDKCKRVRRRNSTTASLKCFSWILILQLLMSCQVWEKVESIGSTGQTVRFHNYQQNQRQHRMLHRKAGRQLQQLLLQPTNKAEDDASSTSTKPQRRQQEQQAPPADCPITCFNDAVCKEGNATFTTHPRNSVGDELEIHHEKNIKGYHCVCPPGFTGVSCKVKYETCADGNSTHICYHGGKCVPGQTDQLGNEQYHCDCSSASTSLASSGGDGDGSGGAFGSRYAGKYCDLALNVCDNSNGGVGGGTDNEQGGAGTNFCANGGTCKVNPTPAEPPCECDPAWTGAHCEYSVKDEQLPPVCNLDCQNGGSCQVGVPIDRDESNPEDVDYSSFTYCLCAEGFSGRTCESKSADPCGDDHVCYHGGRCVVEPDTDGSVGEEDFYCDCNEGATDTKRYAGRYCQYESTEICANNHNGVSFCVNNGECIDEGAGIFSCECSAGFHGPRCEFEDRDVETRPPVSGGSSGGGGNNDTGESPGSGGSGGGNTGSSGGGNYPPVPTQPPVSNNGSGGSATGSSANNGGDADAANGGNASYEVCTLECMNGGKCREGAKDLSGSYLNLGPELSAESVELDQSTSGRNFEHCVCPIGYTGIKCEYEVDECRSDDGNEVEHICLHGSRCTKQDGAQTWTCECEDAFTESSKYAGKFCQHHHTTTCAHEPDSPLGYEGPTSLAFCVNDGTCIEIVEDGQRHQGCKCPDAYTGIHCELLKKVRPNQGGSDDSGAFSGHSSDYAILFVILLLVIVLIVIAGAIYYRLKEGTRQRRKRLERDHIDHTRIHQETSNMDQLDFNDEEEINEEDMEEVELL